MKKEPKPCGTAAAYKRHKYYNEPACDSCTTANTKYKINWQKNNIEKAKKNYKIWYNNNSEKVKKNTKNWQKNNMQKNKENIKLWQQKNKDKKRQYNRKRKALRLGNGHKFFTEKEVLDLYGTNCYLCNTPINLKAPRRVGILGWQYGLHIEHVIDLALGGPDTLENVRPSHAVCNLKKKPVGMV